MTALGAVMACVFCVLFYVTLWKHLTSWKHRKTQLSDREESVDDESTAQEQTTNTAVVDKSWMRLHVPAIVLTLMVLHLGLAIALDWDSYSAMISAFLNAYIILLCFYSSPFNKERHDARALPVTAVPCNLVCAMALLSTASFLIASILFASVSYKTIPYARYTYLGPMHIIGFGNRFGRNATYPKYSGMCVEESIPTSLLAWGGEWACPDTPNQYCEAYVDSGSYCNYAVCQEDSASSMLDCAVECSQDDYEAAEANSQACMENTQLYQDTMERLENGGFNADEDAHDTEGWVSKSMYGDCNSCEVRIASIVDSERAKNNEITSIFGIIGGATGILWLLALCNEPSRHAGDRAVVLLESSGVSA